MVSFLLYSAKKIFGKREKLSEKKDLKKRIFKCIKETYSLYILLNLNPLSALN